MFTSRSEHRLILREDNADQRITEKAYKVGLVSESRYKIFSEKKDKIIKEKDKLAKLFLRPEDEKIYSSLKIKEPKSATSFLDLLKRPDLDFQDLAKVAKMKYKRIDNANELEKKLDEAIKFTGPVLVEVNVHAVGEMPRYFAPPPHALKD